ncbi:MAG: serine/threonine protein kinase [Acidobacteria bacterium]|nr:serine/threonine protein kinase [Acidobacteriota bacterium]
MSENKLGRYELKSILGQGAMGIVYKAWDPEIGREVAIKTIRLELADSGFEMDELKSRFLNEARSAGKMNHPNIVTIFDVGYQGNIAFIAMEFIEGNDLKEYMKSKGELSFAEIFRILYGVSSGLDYSSSKGIIHRDIKPANILLTADGDVKISDFGIAKLPTSEVTQSGMLMGTPAYVSPEQVMGKKLDVRSDLYSLGVVFYELISGKRPFSGDPTTVIFQVVQTPPPKPEITMKGVPPKLQDILLKILAKKPVDRYQTGEELIEAVKKLKGISPDDIDLTKKLKFAPLPKRKEKPIPSNHIERIMAEAAGGPSDEKTQVQVSDQAKTVVIDTSPTIQRKRKQQRSIRQFVWFLIFLVFAFGYYHRSTINNLVDKILGKDTPSNVTAANNKNHIKKPIKNGKTTSAVEEEKLVPVLALTSEPDGANIFIGGEDTGLVTPASYQIPEDAPEDMALEIKKECYSPFAKEFKRKEVTEEGFAAVLEPMKKEVKLNIEPADSQIMVNGEAYTFTTPGVIELSCLKPMQVIASKDKYKTALIDLDFKTAEEAYNLKLEKINGYGYFKFASSYPVEVFSYGQKLAAFKQSYRIKLPQGKNKIEVVSKSPVFINNTYEVDVVKDKTKNFRVPDSGILTATSEPADAKIIIDGIEMENSPVNKLKIVKGEHTVTFKWPDGIEVTKKVSVASGKETTIQEKKP